MSKILWSSHNPTYNKFIIILYHYLKLKPLFSKLESVSWIITNGNYILFLTFLSLTFLCVCGKWTQSPVKIQRIEKKKQKRIYNFRSIDAIFFYMIKIYSFPIYVVIPFSTYTTTTTNFHP